MNFLEQLASEWYKYQGYFVITNIRFGLRLRGGYAGEMDIVGYKYTPETKDFVHIEASTDARDWARRKKIFEKKFTDARKYYMELFPFKEMDIRPRQIALVGLNLNPKTEVTSWKSLACNGSPWEDIKIEVVHIPKFFKQITTELKNRNPLKNVIPETYPLLRAIQYSAFYNKEK